MRLRVHIDATPLFDRNPRGIGSYVVNLVEELCRRGVEVMAAFKFSRIQRFWRLGRVPRCAKKRLLRPDILGRVQVFHGVHRWLPKGNFPKVLTVHDMLEMYGEWEFEVDLAAMERMRRKTLRAFAMEPEAVIAVSQFAKSEILRFTDYPSERVFVIYHGVPKWAYPPKREEVQTVIGELGLRERGYLLFLGEPEGRKNLKLVLEGMPPDLALVVSGGRLRPQDREIAKKRGIRVLEFPFLPAGRVRALMGGALALAFPSLYEGFGMPIIEAMAAGCPVITSTHPATAEVAGGAALLVDPRDPGQFAEAVQKLLGHPQLRKDLIVKGLKRASQFSWERTAEETIEVYRFAMGEGRGL